MRLKPTFKKGFQICKTVHESITWTFSISSPLKSIHSSLPNCKCMPTLIYDVAFTSTAPEEINRDQFPRGKVLQVKKSFITDLIYYKENAGSLHSTHTPSQS